MNNRYKIVNLIFGIFLLFPFALFYAAHAEEENNPGIEFGVETYQSSLINRIKMVLPDPGLTHDELAWINQKKVIKLGIASPFYPPFDITSGLYDYDGINADYLGLIAYNLYNTEISVFYYSTYEKMFEGLKKGEIDLIANATDYIGKKEALILSDIYFNMRPVLVERVGPNEKTNNTGVNIGVEYTYSLDPNYTSLIQTPQSDESNSGSNIHYVIYESSRRALELLSFNKINFFISDRVVVNYIVNQGNLVNLRFQDLPLNGMKGYAFAATKKNEKLISIIDKILKTIPNNVKNDIQQRWSGGAVNNLLTLTPLEKKWIENNHVIRVAVCNDVPPLSFTGSNGNFQGIAADFLEKFSQQTNLKFEITYSSSLNNAVKAVKNNKADIIIGATLDSIWSNGLLTSRTFLFNSWVMVGRTEIENPHKIILINGSPFENTIKHNYPDSQVIMVEDTYSGLDMLTKGNADGFILPRLSADYIIYHYHDKKLKIIDIPNVEPARFVIGVSNDKYPLTVIFNKALLNIPPEYVHDLVNKWYVNSQYLETKEMIKNKNNKYLYYIVSLFLITTLAALILANFIYRRRLKEYHTHQSTLLDSLPIPLYLTHFNHKIIFANRVFLKTLMLPYDHVKGLTLKELGLSLDNSISYHNDDLKIFPQDNKTLTIATQQLIINEQPHLLYHWSVIHASEDHQHAYGNIGGWLDVTEHEKLIQELQQAKEIADSANRTKTSFLATISHEIRTPINAIVGILELLLQRKQSGDTDWDSLKLAHDSAQSLLSLIADILDIAKIESDRMILHPERTDLRYLIESVVLIFDGLARQKNIELQLDIDSQASGDVFIDPLRFKQVLSNIVGNAIKFTDIGKVIICVNADDISHERLNLTIQVIDTGIGIDEVTKNNLFKPFSQGNSEKKGAGSGLGLYICKTLIDMMGGTISLSSQLGIGTEITLTLSIPKLTKIEKPITDQLINKKGIKNNIKLNVLVVEDNKANRMLLAQQLQFLGHNTYAAESGEEALNILKHEPVSLVITDCNMPKMNGYMLTQRIRQKEKQTKCEPLTILGLTADARSETREKCLNVGMDECLFKPFELNALSEKLTDIAEKIQLKKTLAVSTETKSSDYSMNYFQEQDLPVELTSSPQILISFINIMIESLQEDNTKLEQLIASQHFSSKTAKQLAHKIIGGVQLIKSTKIIYHCEQIRSNPSVSNTQQLSAAITALIKELKYYQQTVKK